MFRELELGMFCGEEKMGGPSWVATLDGRVSEDKEREVKVVVEVSKGEFMMCGKWACK